MPTPLKTILKDIGLSQSETDVYVASLKLGEAQVTDIAHACRMTRTTAASILERLEERGLVSVHRSKGRTLYWIEDPHVLIEQERDRLKLVEHLAGRLHTLYHSEDKKPTAEIYDSKESIMRLMTKVVEELGKGDEMLTFEAPLSHHYQTVMSEERFMTLAGKRAKKGVLTRSLIPEGQEEAVRPEALRHNVEVRVMPSGLAFETSLWIFRRSVVTFSGTHLFAVRTNHKHTAESFRSLFEFIWRSSRPLH